MTTSRLFYAFSCLVFIGLSSQHLVPDAKDVLFTTPSNRADVEVFKHNITFLFCNFQRFCVCYWMDHHQSWKLWLSNNSACLPIPVPESIIGPLYWSLPNFSWVFWVSLSIQSVPSGIEIVKKLHFSENSF